MFSIQQHNLQHALPLPPFIHPRWISICTLVPIALTPFPISKQCYTNHQILKPNLKLQQVRQSVRAVEEGVNFLKEGYCLKGKSCQEMEKSIQLLYVSFWLGEQMSTEAEAPAPDPPAWSCSSCREFDTESRTSPKYELTEQHTD